VIREGKLRVVDVDSTNAPETILRLLKDESRLLKIAKGDLGVCLGEATRSKPTLAEISESSKG
jgi:hypothetical protein